jgi:endonuclease YncB( thermonuclease family)
MRTKTIIITILFVTSAIFYYQITDATTIQEHKVTRIIDGDTIKLENGQTIRLKGINTPEKSMPFHTEATNFLTKLVQNKTIQIETYGTDKYGRTLAHIFLDNKNINEQILTQGLATLYYYNPDKHYEKLKQAEEFARLNQKALWQKSPNTNCIEIIEFKTDEPESLTIQNKCNKILEITFKDDATHIYHATLAPNSAFTQNTSHIWNTDGDSIYIRDKKGLLLFHRY